MRERGLEQEPGELGEANALQRPRARGGRAAQCAAEQISFRAATVRYELPLSAPGAANELRAVRQHLKEAGELFQTIDAPYWLEKAQTALDTVV